MTDVRIITETLGGSPLSRALQGGTAPAEWTAGRPTSAGEWRARAEQRMREREWEDCWRLLEPALAATGRAAQRLERVRREGGVVITTGQQPGLFGGPVYTWSKAMGALALADAVEQETGIATAAIFWAATDDADFAEASYTVLARTGGAEVLRSTNAPVAGTPMAFTPLGDVEPLLAKLRDACAGAADPRPLESVERAYASDATVGSAYITLLRTTLEPLGIPVLDASHAAVRAASDTMLRLALDRAPQVEDALRDRSRAIAEAGFAPQVEDVPGLTLVFAREDGIKRRLSVAESGGVAADAVLTPNVLLRPIVERDILPTVAYVAGPGELAYFAQTSAVADVLGLERPLAVPRWSCTLITPQVQRLLERFGVGVDALATPDALEGQVARAAMSAESARAIDELRNVIQQLPGRLAAETNAIGLDPAMEGAMQSLLHRVDRMERRLVAGVKRRETELLRDVGTLRAALYPLGTRQERALNLIPLLSRHGLGLLADMHSAAGGHARALVTGPAADAT